MDISALNAEVQQMLEDAASFEDMEHLWEPYQKVTGYLARLTQIHNDLAWREITGEASPQEKKFRTMIVDKAMETFEKLASFESRKITAKKLEIELDRE